MGIERSKDGDRRGRSMMWATLGACFLFLAVLLSTAAAEALPAPGGFRLRASNGYSLAVAGLRNPKTGRGAIFVFVRDARSAVFYVTRGSVTDTSIEAKLGSVGRIDVNFVPTGQPRTERSVCGGKPVTIDSGRYEGTIDFTGEEGYSEVHTTGARGSAEAALSLICWGQVKSEGIGGHSPGALLRIRHRGEPRFQFEARKNSPSRSARFSASIGEQRGSLFISRAVGAVAAPDAFSYDFPSGVARVNPPAPFAGEATFDRRLSVAPSWNGNLSVDFPGRSDVRLTGPDIRASLIRAVQNPGHPFRIP
jgi:hypothetical protein